MAIEIVDLPNYKIVIFHIFVNVYQRVTPFESEVGGSFELPLRRLLHSPGRELSGDTRNPI